MNMFPCFYQSLHTSHKPVPPYSSTMQTASLAPPRHLSQCLQSPCHWPLPPACRPHRPRNYTSVSITHAVQKESYQSNLGVLQPVVEQSVSPAEDPYAMQRVSPDSFSSRGYYLDGTAIFGSLVLLVLLLAVTFERILGLDRVVNQALRNWKESREYERRKEIIEARQALEDSWDGDDAK